MKKIIILSFVLSLFCAGASFSATGTGTPSIYQVTLKKIELYNNTTGEWVTAGEGDLVFNIASGSAGATIGSYISGKAIPVGTYTQVRATVSRTMSIKSSGTVGGTTYYTTATTVSVPSNGATAVTISANVANYTTGTMVAPSTSSGADYTVSGGNFTATHTFTSSVVFKKGANKKLTIKFDVTNAVTFDDVLMVCYPNAVSVTWNQP